MKQGKAVLSLLVGGVAMAVYVLLVLYVGQYGYKHVTLAMYVAVCVNLLPLLAGGVVGLWLVKPNNGIQAAVEAALCVLLLPVAFPAVMMRLFGVGKISTLALHGSASLAALAAVFIGIFLGHALHFFLSQRDG